jgi:hypothetical protein
MTNWIRVTGVGALTAILTIGFGIAGQIWGLLLALLLGLGWAIATWPPKDGDWNTRPDLDGPGLLIFIALTVWGMWLGLPAGLALVAVLLTLAAWDLGRFVRRLSLALDATAAARLERIHLLRLGLALGGGLLLGGLALIVRTPLDFGWALGLGILAIFALSRVARGMNRNQE